MLLKKDRPKLILPQTEKINLKFSVLERIKRYLEKEKTLAPEREALETEYDQLDLSGEDPEKWLDIQRSELIERKLRLLDIKSVTPPLELDYEELQRIPDLRRFLVAQFKQLPIPEKLAWFDTFSSFIVTPDVTGIYKQIQDIVEDYQIIGQQYNLLLGGQSGMGKTSLQLLLMLSNPPVRMEERTISPLKLAEAPPYDTAKKAFPRILVQAAGALYNSEESEEELYSRAVGRFLQSRTILLLVDEVQNLARYDLRRKFIHFSNRCSVPIVCASSEPTKFTEGDGQTTGRWKDPYTLEAYKGERLKSLLGYIDLLLPFPADSHLADFQVSGKKKENEDGPAKLIEQRTKGNLRDILRLIRKSCKRAIRGKKKRLTVKELHETADELKLKP